MRLLAGYAAITAIAVCIDAMPGTPPLRQHLSSSTKAAVLFQIGGMAVWTAYCALAAMVRGIRCNSRDHQHAKC